MAHLLLAALLVLWNLSITDPLDQHLQIGAQTAMPETERQPARTARLTPLDDNGWKVSP